MEVKSLAKTQRILIGLLVAVAVAGTAYAQTGSTTIKPIASFNLPKPVVIDTRDQVPQIAPVSRRTGNISENDSVNTLKKDVPPNNLPVGGMLSYAQGSASKLQFAGPGFTNGWPPDCDMAVGPNHVVCVVNEQMAIYDKLTGSKQFQTNLTGDQFFSGIGVVSGEVISDPKIQYDKASGHWFVHIIEVDGLVTSGTKGSFQLIGVSETSDPNGKWKKYRIDSSITSGGTQYWLDYPGVGTSSDGFVFTGNMFGFTSGYLGGGIFAISKASLISGTAGKVTVFFDPGAGTIEPARNYDTTAPYVYMMTTNSTSSVKTYAVSNFLSTPVLVSSVVNVPTFTPPTRDANGPQGHVMDGFSDARMFTAVRRGGSIYGAHNCMSPSGAVLACRWYEVAVNNWPTAGVPTLVQSGNIYDASGVLDSHMPAINVNKYGSISVVYTRCGPNLEASIQYSAHKKSDPPGTMGLPVALGYSPANSGAQPGSRWGDYFNVSIDPSDDAKFWGFGELCVANGLWTTQVNSWTVADPSLSIPYAPSAANVIDGSLVSGSAASLAAVDGNTMNVTSANIPGNFKVASVEALYTTKLKPSSTDLLTLTTAATIPSGATKQFYAWDWTKNKYIYLGAVSATTTSDFTIANNTLAAAPYIKSDGTVKLLYRIVYPNRTSAAPSFTLKLDQLLLKGLPSTS